MWRGGNTSKFQNVKKCKQLYYLTQFHRIQRKTDFNQNKYMYSKVCYMVQSKELKLFAMVKKYWGLIY